MRGPPYSPRGQHSPRERRNPEANPWNVAPLWCWKGIQPSFSFISKFGLIFLTTFCTCHSTPLPDPHLSLRVAWYSPPKILPAAPRVIFPQVETCCSLPLTQWNPDSVGAPVVSPPPAAPALLQAPPASPPAWGARAHTHPQPWGSPALGCPGLLVYFLKPLHETFMLPSVEPSHSLLWDPTEPLEPYAQHSEESFI